MLNLIVRAIFYLSSVGLVGIVLIQMSEHAGLGGAFGAGGRVQYLEGKKKPIRNGLPRPCWQPLL